MRSINVQYLLTYTYFSQATCHFLDRQILDRHFLDRHFLDRKLLDRHFLDCLTGSN